MDVRRLGPPDWALLRDLRLACLRDAPEAFGSSLARELDRDEAAWRARVVGSAWFVAAGSAGIARGAVPRDDAPGRRYLHSMWVRPERRGSGVGDALVAAVREWAVADGAAELALWVIEGNTAAGGLYGRAGFAPNGVRQALPDRPGAWEQQWVLSLDDGRPRRAVLAT